MEILPELVNLGNGSATHGDRLATDICRTAIQEMERLRAELSGQEDRADDAETEAATMAGQILELRAVVDKLPKLADGKTALWFDVVWSNKYSIGSWIVAEVRPGNVIQLWDGAGSKFWVSSLDYYNTEAAAKAAKGK